MPPPEGLERFAMISTYSWILALALTPSAFALAADNEPKPSAACRDVMEACKAAGFKRGEHKNGKGIHADCVGKLFKGESVAGVNVPADKIESCKQRHEAMMNGAAVAPDSSPHGSAPAGAIPKVKLTPAPHEGIPK